MISIVIPCADSRPDTRNQLENLLESIVIGKTHENAKIICCFDGCDENWVEWFKDKYPFILSIWNDGNRLGFCANSNLGLRFAYNNLDTHAILCNQDTILPPWEILKNLERPGLCSAGNIDLKQVNPLNRQIYTLEQESKIEYISVMDVGPPNKFAGFCYFINKAVMEEIGYLYENYRASFDDDDYIARALIAGFPVEISSIKCYHSGSFIDQGQIGESQTGAYSNNLLGLNLMVHGERWQLPIMLAPDKPLTHNDFIIYIVNHYKGRWVELKKFLYCN